MTELEKCGFRLTISCLDGTEIISPIIAPDNPGTRFDDVRVAGKIEKYGRSMAKTLPDVVNCGCVIQ